MSFMLDCPQIGKRHVGEFTFGGEFKSRPSSSESDFDHWVDYVFHCKNTMGKILEWWYHRPTEQWFLVYRDTTKNTDHVCFSYEEREGYKEFI